MAKRGRKPRRKPGPKPGTKKKKRGISLTNGKQVKSLAGALETLIKLPNVKFKIIIGD